MKKIIRHTDDITTPVPIPAESKDESKRQNELTHAEIRLALRGQIIAFTLLTLNLILATVVAIVTRDTVITTAFLTLPLVAIIGKLFHPVFSRSDASVKQAG